jgi:hypothetical protein
VAGEAVFDYVACPDSEHDVGIQLWFALEQIADDLGAHHLFVDGIRDDVLPIERHARFGCAHPPECIDEPS